MTAHSDTAPWTPHVTALMAALDADDLTGVAQSCRLLCEHELPLQTALDVSNALIRDQGLPKASVMISTSLRLGTLPHALRLALAADGLALHLTTDDGVERADTPDGTRILLLDHWTRDTDSALDAVHPDTLGILDDGSGQCSAPLPDAALQDSFKLTRSDVLDTRMSALGVKYLSLESSRPLAAHIAKRVRARHGRSRKLILCDLDGLLWPGVLGETGPEHICGDAEQFAPHHALQSKLAALANTGKAQLTILSKNTPQDVRDAFAANPLMPLNINDFIQIEASWIPKPEVAAKTLANATTSPAHAIFLDDNPVEQMAMRAAFPDIATPECASDATKLTKLLTLIDWTWSGLQTREDTLRAASIATQDTARQHIAMTGGLEALAMSSQALTGDNLPVQRAQQLYRRVTQFNTTGDIRDAAQIAAIVATPSKRLIAYNLRDHLADHGVVALCHLNITNDTCTIAQILVSCRVLGRGLDTLILKDATQRAQNLGCTHITCTIRNTDRNEPVRDLFDRHSFTRTSQTRTETSWMRAIVDEMEWPAIHITLQGTK